MARAIGGDRVVIAVVSGRIGKNENSALKVTGDRELPRKVLNDNPIVYQESLAATRTLLTKAFEAALAKPRTDRTELLRSIRDASRDLSAERKRQKILIVLSDMLQDSAEYQFERTSLSEAFTKTVIATAQRDHTLPDLQGVRIYTQVPGVATPAKAEQVERFWITTIPRCLRGKTQSPDVWDTGKLSSVILAKHI